MTFTITPAAARRILVLLKDEAVGSFLRLSITGGGCSGFQYNFTFDTVITPDDKMFIQDTAKVGVDDISLGLLNGSILDFMEDLASSSFVVKNPNATMGCGCGNSFSL